MRNVSVLSMFLRAVQLTITTAASNEHHTNDDTRREVEHHDIKVSGLLLHISPCMLISVCPCADGCYCGTVILRKCVDRTKWCGASRFNYFSM